METFDDSEHTSSPLFLIGYQPSEADVDELVDKSEKYTLANHLFWGLWGIISVTISTFITLLCFTTACVRVTASLCV